MDLLQSRRIDRREPQRRLLARTARRTLIAGGLAALAACASEFGTRRVAVSPPPFELTKRSSEAEACPAGTADPRLVSMHVEPPVIEASVETDATSAMGTASQGTDWTDPCLEVSELEVYDVLERFYRDFAHGDWSSMGERFWPGASVIAIRRREQDGEKQVVTESIEACIERLRAQVSRTKPLEITFDEYRIEPTGAIAQASIKYSAIDTSGDAPQSWSGTDAFTLVRHEGEWRIASLVFGSSMFGP
jgi:hypothetical protein